jgi:hypothetical protein
MPRSGWIWNQKQETDNGMPKLVYFRKTLRLDTKPKMAVVKVSADSRYRLYVNGQSVSFGPCKGDDQVWYADEVDIAPFLKPGENVMAAVVLRYSPLHTGNYSVWRTSTPGFYLEGAAVSGGETLALRADDSWQCKAAAHIEVLPEEREKPYLYIRENAGGNIRFKDWLLPGYDDSCWEKAAEYPFLRVSKTASPGNLLPRPIPFLYEKERRFKGLMCVRQSVLGKEQWERFIGRAALEIPADDVEIVELDAGELTTGFLRLVCAGGKGARIEILTSESYAYETDDPSPYAAPRKGDRADWKKGKLYGDTDTYQPGGYGDNGSPEEYEPFWFRTFRFVRLHITTGNEPLTLLDFYYRETGYPLEVKTQVEMSAPELYAIWDISLRTLRRCMHETYEDCPFYEQRQYVMDSRLQILYTYSVSADDRMARRCIDDFHRSLRYDGLTSASFPCVYSRSCVIPGFSLYYVMMIHDHMMYFGDRGLVERYMPTVDAILSFFERNRDERGIVGKIGFQTPDIWSFVDWTPEWMGGVPTAIYQGPLTFESLLYAYALSFAAELADYAGRKERAAGYRERADSVRAAVNTYCVGKNGLYQDGPGVDQYSQHCQVFAVLSETAADWKLLMEQCLKRENEGENMARCSVAMAFYLFRALEKAGLYDRTGPLWNPWREMLKNNLTTCEEDQVTARSDCHAWASLALYELPAVVLGIRPASPGYGSIKVNPNPGFLTWAKGKVITPRGTVQVSWEKTEEGIKLDVKAPEGVAIVTGKFKEWI